ncbi:MAG: hypothetical protein JRJ77_00550 [Deltaproteobacteria bacterium]|nr:hypothetical protein [Deltaproteobacteria bacterium]MBW2339020.1 hypothetical protein [Deltaproteobacteria bacterium]
MGINELFDGIAKVVEQFAEESAERKLQERMSRTGLPRRSSAGTRSGRGPKMEAEKTEKEGETGLKVFCSKGTAGVGL